jgi:hypothetical protein
MEQTQVNDMGCLGSRFGPGGPSEALMGAYAQGGDFSPLGWVCTMGNSE